jgi:hypothetical protein
MTRMMGGAFACPTSFAKSGWDTFLTTSRHEAAVATARKTHETTGRGMMHKSVTGKYGTRLYPYKHTHSARVRAFMPMQHCVVIHKMVGNTNPKAQQMYAALRR